MTRLPGRRRGRWVRGVGTDEGITRDILSAFGFLSFSLRRTHGSFCGSILRNRLEEGSRSGSNLTPLRDGHSIRPRARRSDWTTGRPLCLSSTFPRRPGLPYVYNGVLVLTSSTPLPTLKGSTSLLRGLRLRTGGSVIPLLSEFVWTPVRGSSRVLVFGRSTWVVRLLSPVPSTHRVY